MGNRPCKPQDTGGAPRGSGLRPVPSIWWGVQGLDLGGSELRLLQHITPDWVA